MIPEANEKEIENRLDLSVIRAYRDAPETVTQTRERFRSGWRNDQSLARLSLSHLEGMEALSEAEDDQAFKNIVDYWFEPLVLPSMNLGQIRDYYLAIKDRFNFEIAADVHMPSGRPMLIQTIHHCCIFSVIYNVIQYLVEDGGFEKAILLHINDALDPRITGCVSLIENILQAETSSIQLQGEWLPTLGQEMTDRTVLIYMGDMPPSLFERHHRPGKTSSIIQLYADTDLSLQVEGISIATTLARRFKAAHCLLDFPETDVVRLRPWEVNAETSCPLSDWVFWPSLRSLYHEIALAQAEPLGAE